MTTSSSGNAVYILDIAGVGIKNIELSRLTAIRGGRDSKVPGILFETIADFQKDNPILDEFGSMNNAYDSGFIQPLFKKCSVCNCGGDIYTWKWEGVRAQRHMVLPNAVRWHWDENGFHCSLNEMEGWYSSKEECEKAAGNINVVKFQDYD